jgi:flavoprotein
MAETIKVWQCIGCGRIDHPQPCVGICQDRKVELVYADDHAESLARVAALEAILRRIAFTSPRPGEWEAAWRALRADARRALDAAPGAP